MIARLAGRIAFVAAFAVISGCANDEVDDDIFRPDGSAGAASATGESSTVSVTLTEYEVTLSQDTVSAGSITFQVANQGSEGHEFVVVETGLPPEDLPVLDDGSFDETSQEATVVDEIDYLAPGSTEELTVELSSGSYVLLCNFVLSEGEDEIESHFHEGMSVEFDVE
jgi:uncharacterized cupredoxin-like copper-binding protein